MNTVSLCMIVKNEYKNLNELLPKIKDIFDEIVIVDTGSDDGTYEYLQSQNYIKCFQIEWENDFSKARNFSISKATQDFIFWMDADDRITFKNNFKDKLNKNWVYFIKVRNSSDNTFFYQLRIFPNFKNIKFEGKVHEQVIFNREKFKTTYLEDIEILHTGYDDRKTLIEKHKRNINILQSIEEKDFYDFLQLAESYKIIGDYYLAYRNFKQALNFKELQYKNIEIYCFIHFELFRIEKLLNLEFPEKWLFKVENIADKFPVIFYYIGRHFFQKREILKAKDYFEKFLDKHRNFKYLNPVPEKINNSALYFLAKIELELSNKKKAKEIIELLLQNEPENKSYQSLKRLL